MGIPQYRVYSKCNNMGSTDILFFLKQHSKMFLVSENFKYGKNSFINDAWKFQGPVKYQKHVNT